MKILCATGSRADLGGIEATHEALLKRGLKSTLVHMDRNYVTTCLIGIHQNTDLVVVLGDRSEILKFVTECFLLKLPIAHLSGGDITEGSQDDCMRHAITKLSHLHFPTNRHAAKVILQMGEEPWRVHTVGYPGADNLVTYDKEIATKLVGAKDYLLIVWHPNTLVSNDQAYEEAVTLRVALSEIPLKCLVLSPNFDAGGLEIANAFEKWANEKGHRYIGTLPRDMFLTVLKYAKCLIGNSSSGFYEAPTFGTPTVNIGNRQKGRIVPPNMTNAAIDVNDIIESINIAITNTKLLGKIRNNAYQTGNAADKIADVIANVKDTQKLLRKQFVHNWTS